MINNNNDHNDENNGDGNRAIEVYHLYFLPLKGREIFQILSLGPKAAFPSDTQLLRGRRHILRLWQHSVSIYSPYHFAMDATAREGGGHEQEITPGINEKGGRRKRVRGEGWWKKFQQRKKKRKKNEKENKFYHRLAGKNAAPWAAKTGFAI